MDSFVANNSLQPRLPQMVNKALDLLQNNNGAGFFLMVEGALIDKLSHSNDRNFTPEVAQLDLAVQEAFAWASPNRTGPARHRHGRSRDGRGQRARRTGDHARNDPDHQLQQHRSHGRRCAGVCELAGRTRGQTIDNTEVFYIMEDYLEGGKPPQITDLSVSGITETGATVQWNTTELSDSQVVLSGHRRAVRRHRAGGGSHAPLHRPPAWHHLHADGVLHGPGRLYRDRPPRSSPRSTPSSDALVHANPVVLLGTLAGNFQAVAAPNDGLTQTITEAADGVGSGLQAEYTLHTQVQPSADHRAGTLRGGVLDAQGWCQRQPGDRGPRARAGRRLRLGTHSP